MENTVLKQYLCPLIPHLKKKHHERQLIQKINEYCKLTTNYTMKLKIALAQNIYFLIYCVLVQKKLFQSTNWTTTYTNMSVITMFFHKPFQVALRRQLFLGHVMDQQFTLLLCMLNGTHMGPYKYCSYSEFHHVNLSQGWIHEFLERWWLVVQVAYKQNNRRSLVFQVMNSPRQTCSKKG